MSFFDARSQVEQIQKTHPLHRATKYSTVSFGPESTHYVVSEINVAEYHAIHDFNLLLHHNPSQLAPPHTAEFLPPGYAPKFVHAHHSNPFVHSIFLTDLVFLIKSKKKLTVFQTSMTSAG